MRSFFSNRHSRLVPQLAAIELTAWGILYYTFSALLPAMERELGWSTTLLSAGFSLALLVSGLAAPWVGRWIDRKGPRQPMGFGCVMGIVGVLLWSQAHQPVTFFLAWFLIGGAMATTLYTPAFAAVIRLRPHTSRKDIVLITLVGGLASTVFLPLAGALEDPLGWRKALIVLAGVLATTTLPLTFFLPKFRAQKRSAKQEPAASIAQKVSPDMRTLTFAFLCADGASAAINAHLIVFLIAQGHGLSLAASIAGLMGVAKVAGRVWSGWGSWPVLSALRLSFLLMATALVLPLIWPVSAAAIGMVLLVGAAGGARTVLRPLIVVALFGKRDFGSRNGGLQVFTTLGRAAGPVGFAVLMNQIGLSWAWAALAVLVALGGLSLLRLKHADHGAPVKDETLA